MRLQFIDRSGREQVIDGLPEFIAAVRDGELSSDTLVFDGTELRWRKASELVELSTATSDPQTPVGNADSSPIPEEPTQDSALPGSPSDVLPDGPVLDKTALAPQCETSERVTPDNVGSTGLQTPLLKWARSVSGTVMYGVIVGLSYALVKSIAPLVKDEFITLALTLVGAVGAVMGVRGLFLRKQTTATWERVVAMAVVLSVVTSFGLLVFTNLRAKATVERTHARLNDLTQKFEAEVKATGMTDLFEMLAGQRQFDISRVVEIRSHMAELDTSMTRTITSAQGYLRECKDNLSASDPNSLFLEHLLQTLSHVMSIRREYFAELGRFMAFLVSTTGTYTVTSQGLIFRRQMDADIYHDSLKRIGGYEEQLETIASEMNRAAKPNTESGGGRSLYGLPLNATPHPETCRDPHEHLGSSGVCWCESGYTRDVTTLKCLKDQWK
jgi:hypothetical protein